MNILSLFDGISCGQVAVNKSGIKYNNYYASEIDKNAIKVTMDNYPNTIQLGDVNNYKTWNIDNITLLLGGSPCQSFSQSGKQLGFDDPRGQLLHKYIEIKEKYNPKWFLLENVKMKQEYVDQITSLIGVEPVEINSSYFSAQNRPRLYWTNIPLLNYNDKNLTIKDILDNSGNYEFIDQSKVLNKFYGKTYLQYDPKNLGHRSMNHRARYLTSKMGTLTHSMVDAAKILLEDGRIRKTTRFEHERLQCLPDGYTKCLELNKAKGAIGNGWTVDVIAHIFQGLKNELSK